MKKFSAFAILALALVFGLAYVSCGNGTANPDDNPDHEHTWGAWTVTTPATCTTQGLETRVCTQNESHTETRAIAALGHAWGAWTVLTQPTATTNGTEIRTCTRNPSHIDTRSVPATGTPGGNQGGNNPDDGSAFVAVTGITGVPTAGTARTPLTLTGTVAPANATNKTIVWTIVGYTNPNPASIDGNTLINNNNGAGNITVRATIANGTAQGTAFTRDFVIVIIWPVGGILDVPTAGTAGTPLTLTGTVSPIDATNKSITWAVKSAGTTGATINGNTLNTTAAGTVTVTATIANGTAAGTNYTQDFTITIHGEALTVLPAAPTGVTATLVLNPSAYHMVRISWNAVPGATSYKVYSSEQSGNWSDFIETTDTSYLTNYLPYNRTYYFKVTAVNSAGEGPASAIVTYQTP